MLLPSKLSHILSSTPALSQAFLVGGCVRDSLLNAPVKDYDIEVYGVDYPTLVAALRSHGRTDEVGKSFGVAKLQLGDGNEYDFSLPRRDSKVGEGHRGFQVQWDARITPMEAASRRDFTINGMMWDPRKRLLLDFFHGRADLERGVLRHTSEAFVEDPLRVQRGMQFAARFKLTAAPSTLSLCQAMAGTYHELAPERVREEWFKWAVKSSQPSRGLRFLRDSGWIRHFPEIDALQGVPQDPEWHPEGDVFVHTGHCLDALTELEAWQTADPETRAVLMFAVLAHDFGKPSTTHEAERKGRMRIVSPEHEDRGGPLAEAFLRRIQAPNAILTRVPPLVTQHMAHLQTQTDKAVRRLANRLQPETIDHLCTVIEADQFGRPPAPKIPSETLLQLRARAKSLTLETQGPKPLVLGRHLMARGLKPSPEFKPLLDAAFEAQLDGVFDSIEGGERWLDQQIGGRENPAKPTA